MISLELLDEFNDIVDSKKCVSKELLKKIILNEIEQCDQITKKNFNNVVFERISGRDALGSFDKEDGIITINHDNMLYKYNKSKKECKEDIFSYNIGFIHAALHEVQHLKEISKSKRDNIEGLIINLSSLDILMDYYDSRLSNIKFIKDKTRLVDSITFQVYKYLYNIVPTERLADIYAYENLFESFSNYPNYDKELLNLLYNCLVFEYHNSYKTKSDSYSPTIDYLNKVKKLLNYNSESFNHFILKFYMLYNTELLTLEEKMRYGLPLPFEERKEIRKVLVNNR